MSEKAIRRATMIAKQQRNLLRRIANIYPGPGGGMDPGPGGGGYAGPGGGKYIGPSRLATGGAAKPTEAQKHAGNYKKQHLSFHGLPISIETAKGETREGVDPNGKPWSVTMPADYGYIKRTEGADGDHVDVYLGPDRHSQMVFLINQHDHGTGKFDEHKVMLGYTSERAAVEAYDKGFSDGKGRGRIGSVEPMSLDAFKHWLKTGKTTKPAKATYIVNSRIARASGGKVPPFKLYSGAAKLIAQKGQAKATPQQYAALPGIKPDELKHTKFDTLPAKAQPKEEVIRHLEGNTVPLQETTYVGDDERSALKRYSGHATLALPGGTNYREVLLHLPAAQMPNAEAAHERANQLAAQAGHGSLENAPAMQRGRLLDAARQQLHDEYSNDTPFRSSHWDQPNVVAHLRMHDRKGPNGEKILHVEEVQSDWGQQGRERGFAKRSREEADREIDALHQEMERRSGKPPSNMPEHWQMLRDQNPDLVAREQELLREREGVVSGPYVDNTQKWTDLALKRVLHEAAHGDYDKVVFTPGDEQNKRYSLDKKVKFLNYYPEGKYLGAVTHDDYGLEHENVAPEDLPRLVGKDVAERLLKQPLENDGSKLGPRHQLSGEGLTMGGAGMKGYYDNILPKRLQALAQQHDPKAKVKLGGHKIPGERGYVSGDDIMEQMGIPVDERREYWRSLPQATRDQHFADAFKQREENGPALHSLDITPQMRDSIKQNGFSQFKRGGTVDPIADWHWRPIEDVRNELQLDEIPSHVHKFGEFMDETARRAMNEGFTPRDLIKAYTITRASIQRRAQPVENIRKSGLILPPDLKGTIRPEGAFGHWLHSKHGQRYLDAAEAGRVDEEAIADAQKVMKPFGKTENDLPDALRWAAKNLPGQEGRISELVTRAYRDQDHPDEWRDATSGLRGIGPAKKGFFGANLGYGKLPTFDAREIVAHTGRPTSEAVPYLRPKGAGDAAVDRLAARQTQLNVKHDKGMSPFYQHLVHHAAWDKIGNDVTTHDDLVDPMRNAARGGRQELKKGGAAEDLGLIGSHPVMRALIEGLPHEAFLPTKHAEMNDLLRSAGVVRPYDDSKANVEKALKIAQDNYLMHTGVGSGKDPSNYYNIRQPVAASAVSTKIAPLRGRAPKPQVNMSWEQLGKTGKGGTLINLAGDRTRIGTLGAINGKKLNWPVHLYGGPEYIREGKPGVVWANNAGVATGLRNTIRKLSQRGPVYGVYSPMSAVSGDQAHHMFDAVMAQIDPKSIDKAHRKAFDEAMRSGAFIMGNTEDVKKDRARVAEKMKGWPGIDNPKEASNFALKSLAGVDRKAIIQYLDKKMWAQRGFPSISMTRAAITDPSVRDVHDNTIGGHVALLHPDQADRQVSGNPTYPEGIAGEYVGTLPFVQKHYAAPVSTAHLVTTPTAGKGKLSHPFSVDDKARSSYRKLYEQNLIPEPIDQRMVDSASEGLEKQKLYGLKKGGVVDRALALTRKVK